MHVHVSHPDGEAKFWLKPEVELATQAGNVSRYGLWLLVGDEELFLPFEQFPWFRDASIEKISLVERPTADHL